MKQSTLLTTILSIVTLLGFSFAANAALDFDPITTAVDDAAGAVVLALGAVAIFKAGPGIAKWGFNKIIGWFR